MYPQRGSVDRRKPLGQSRGVDRVLLFALLPLWAVGFGSGLRATSLHIEFPPFLVGASESPGDFPVLLHFKPTAGGERFGLLIGDRLLALGEDSLRGVGPFHFQVRFAEASARAMGANEEMLVVFERGGKVGEACLSRIPRRLGTIYGSLFVSLVFAGSATLLFLRGRSTPTLRVLFAAFICIALLFSIRWFDSRAVSVALFGLLLISMSLTLPLCLLFAQSFPGDELPSGSWARFWPWIFTAYGPLQASALYGFPLPWTFAVPASLLLVASAIAILVAGSTRKYRRSDPILRRQLRWILYGLYCALLPTLICVLLILFDERFVPFYSFAISGIVLVPIALLISALRYNLFDIDQLISGAVSYSLLVGLLAVLTEVVIEPAAARIAGQLGADPGTGQLVFIAVLAAVLIPIQRVWRPYVDRLFFADGRSRESDVEVLLDELSREGDRMRVIPCAAAGIDRIFAPEFCVAYRRAGDRLEPVYASGDREFPSLFAETDAARALATRLAPISVDRRGLSGPASTGPSAAMSGWPVPEVAVIVPLRPDGAPSGFIGVGSKRSGDVYTTTDLSLLSAIAHTASMLG